MVVGIGPEGHETPALHLAALLARSARDDLLLCAVIPAPWPPSAAKVDAEYRAYLVRTAEATLDDARSRLPDGVSVGAVVHNARRVPAGLLHVAEQHGASLIIVGPSSEAGLGRISLGGVGGWLTHGSPIPVAMPPRGYRCTPTARVTRVTAAYGGSEGADDLVVAAAGFAARVGAPLQLVSFVVRARPPYTSGVGTASEQAMIRQWAEEIEMAGRAVLDRIGREEILSEGMEVMVGYGETWDAALADVDWQDGDLLLLGSSSAGPVARVFLGSRASKIVRHAPVPVMLVPSGARAG